MTPSLALNVSAKAAEPTVIAVLTPRDFARARTVPGFSLWSDWREFRDERDALWIGYGWAGVDACRQRTPFEAFERWVRLTGAPADLAGLDEFAAHWRWRQEHPQAPALGRLRAPSQGLREVAAQGAQCVPVRADLFGRWRDGIARLGLFAPPSLDDYAMHAIACCVAPRSRRPRVKSS